MAVSPARASALIGRLAKSRPIWLGPPRSAPPVPSSRFRRHLNVHTSICASAFTTTFRSVRRRSSAPPLEPRRHPEPARAVEVSVRLFRVETRALAVLGIRKAHRPRASGLHLRCPAVITYQLTTP